MSLKFSFTGLMLVLCSGGWSACAASGAPPAPATATAVEPTAIPWTSPMNRGLALDVTTPILGLEDGFDWDSGHLAPGGVVYHDGMFHMLYNAFLSLDSPNKVGYAVSSDGIVWMRKAETPVFVTADIPWSDYNSNFRVTSLLVDEDSWVMYFSGSRQPAYMLGAIGRATAPSPAGPWTVDSQPVLLPGGEGEWDTLAIGNTDVLKLESGYVMHYSSAGGGVGMAVSADGQQWTKHDDPATAGPRLAHSDPLLNVIGLDDLAVAYNGEYWIMVIGRKVEGLTYAVSADGIHWRHREEPFVSLGGDGMFTRYLALVRHAGRAFLFLEAGVNNTRTYGAYWEEPDPR